MSRTETARHTAGAPDFAMIPAACTIAYPDRDLAAAAAHLADRFGAIELTFDHGVSLPPRPGLIDDLVALRQERGLRYAVHLPLTIQLASPNPALRRASLDTLVDVFVRCAPLEPVAWVLHVTPLFGVERSITSRERAQAQQSRNVALADEALAELLARTGVSSRLIAVENLNYPFAILDDVLERHDLGVCCDVGHLLARGGDPAAFVRRYAARLAHVHLHDVIAGLDHRPLGDTGGRARPRRTLARVGRGELPGGGDPGGVRRGAYRTKPHRRPPVLRHRAGGTLPRGRPSTNAGVGR